MKITIEKANINLYKINEEFKLNILENNSSIEIFLDKNQILELGLQFIELGNIKIKPIQDNNFFRNKARGIIALDDFGIQLILKEIETEVLVDFLWFMKNAELIKKIFKNMNIKFAAIITEQLEKEILTSGDPDDKKNIKTLEKRMSVKKVVDIAYKLYIEKKINYIEGLDE